MSDSYRLKLAQHLFQLPPPGLPLSTAQRVNVELAARTCGAVISDLITHAQKLWTMAGPGALMLRDFQSDSQLDDAIWLTIEQLEEDCRRAEAARDEGIHRVLAKALQLLDGIDPAKAVVLLLIDHRGMQLLHIPTDNPDATAADILKQWSSL